MKDKLRELVGELMSACEMIGYATSGNERANHRATRDKIKAELLAILDAEGDGGADDNPSLSWKWCPQCGGRWSSPEPICEHCDYDCMISTHPARSGVVSDEDVRDAVVEYQIAAGKTGVNTRGLRAALEHFQSNKKPMRI